MDRPRDQLLPGAALAVDEDGERAGGLPDRLHDALHRGGAPTSRFTPPLGIFLAEPLLERLVLGHELALLERLLDHVDDLLVAEGLRDVVERALAHRRDRALDRRVGGDDDDRDLRGCETRTSASTSSPGSSGSMRSRSTRSMARFPR